MSSALALRALAASVLSAGLVLAPGIARANGVFPSVNQLVEEPGNPDHLVLRSTFGLLVTRDGGGSWDWLCEQGMGYENTLPPMAVLPGGVILLAVPDGISRSDESGCDFRLAAGIQGIVLDLARVPAEPDGAVAVGLDGSMAVLFRSRDAGQSFAPLGEPIPDLVPVTVDVAAADPGVMYVSGSTGSAGVILRSTDRFGTFDTFSVPDTSPTHRPFIAAVAPDDPETVYVRLDGKPSELLVTHDGGETFRVILQTSVPALGFALSPDGATVLASNGVDGTFRASTKTLAFERVACGGPSCLSYGEGGLFGCGDELSDHYIVGRSEDRGATFDPLVNLSCIRAPVSCAAETSTGAVCPAVWPAVQAQLGALRCTPEDPRRDTSCFAAGAGGEGGSANPAAGGTRSASGGASAAPPVAKHGGGCALAAAGRAGSPGAWLSVSALALGGALFGRQRRHSARKRRA